MKTKEINIKELSLRELEDAILLEQALFYKAMTGREDKLMDFARRSIALKRAIREAKSNGKTSKEIYEVNGKTNKQLNSQIAEKILNRAKELVQSIDIPEETLNKLKKKQLIEEQIIKQQLRKISGEDKIDKIVKENINGKKNKTDILSGKEIFSENNEFEEEKEIKNKNKKYNSDEEEDKDNNKGNKKYSKHKSKEYNSNNNNSINNSISNNSIDYNGSGKIPLQNDPEDPGMSLMKVEDDDFKHLSLQLAIERAAEEISLSEFYEGDLPTKSEVRTTLDRLVQKAKNDKYNKAREDWRQGLIATLYSGAEKAFEKLLPKLEKMKAKDLMKLMDSFALRITSLESIPNLRGSYDMVRDSLQKTREITIKETIPLTEIEKSALDKLLGAGNRPEEIIDVDVEKTMTDAIDVSYGKSEAKRIKKKLNKNRKRLRGHR